MQRSDFDCCICSDLLYEPVSLPCGHNICHEHCSNDESNTEDCPLCRAKYTPSTLKPNIMLCQIIERTYTDEYNKRRSEYQAGKVVSDKITTYFKSTRSKTLQKHLTTFIEKSTFASFKELELAMSGIFELKYGTSMPAAEVRMACYHGNEKKWNVTSWGIYSPMICNEKYINYALSYFARQRLLEDSSVGSRLVDDKATGMKILPSLELTQSERDVFADICLHRTSIMMAFALDRSIYNDISMSIIANVPKLSSKFKSEEYVYPIIKDYVDIILPSHINPEPLVGETQRPASGSLQPPLVDWGNNNIVNSARDQRTNDQTYVGTGAFPTQSLVSGLTLTLPTPNNVNSSNEEALNNALQSALRDLLSRTFGISSDDLNVMVRTENVHDDEGGDGDEYTESDEEDGFGMFD